MARMTTHSPSQAYRALALRLHPDKNPDKSEKGQAAYVRVQKAYELLTDKDARAALDDLQKCVPSLPSSQGTVITL